ncbi:PepSY-like domain-containing protein [Pedobacter antarcticus]|uniref:PepSY-like domain-containing protein n=1 Tax=Pedobacter antarcticus TaxID=34086 RepID=UPI00292E8B5A|nr:PepSY-like domain-containing protein [Pedobacter antarcticus]
MKLIFLSKLILPVLIAILILFNAQPLQAHLVSDEDIKEKDVPVAVVKAIKDKYADIYIYNWEWSKKKNYYRATFVFKGDEYKLYLNPAGQISKTDKKTQFAVLPSNIRDSFGQTEFASWFVSEAREITENDITVYQIKVKNDKKWKLKFDSAGKLIKNEKD